MICSINLKAIIYIKKEKEVEIYCFFFFFLVEKGRHYPTKGQSHIHRINLGFGPTRSRKDEKEAEKEKVAESMNYCKK